MKVGDYVIIKSRSELENLGYYSASCYVLAFANKLGRIIEMQRDSKNKPIYYRIKIGLNDRTWFLEDAFIKYNGGV